MRKRLLEHNLEIRAHCIDAQERKTSRRGTIYGFHLLANILIRAKRFRHGLHALKFASGVHGVARARGKFKI